MYKVYMRIKNRTKKDQNSQNYSQMKLFADKNVTKRPIDVSERVKNESKLNYSET